MSTQVLNRVPEFCVICRELVEGPRRVRACFCGHAHYECALRRVLKQELRRPQRAPACRTCAEPYRISPQKSLVVRLLENANYVWLQDECECLALAIFLALFDSGVCLAGAYTIGKAVGDEESTRLLEDAGPIVAAAACRAVFAAAVAVNCFRCWEDALLTTLHRCSKAPLVGWLLPQCGSGDEGEPTFPRAPPSSHFGNLLGGLMLPRIAKAFGDIFFEGHSNLNRFLLGGLTFVTLRGIFSMYFKQAEFSRQLNMTVLSYEPEEHGDTRYNFPFQIQII